MAQPHGLSVAAAADLLSRGDVFVKFHERTNKSAKRFMFLESGTLYWCKEGSRVKSSKHSCSLSQMSHVAAGKDASLAVYKQNEAAVRAPADLCFSLVFAAAGMSLNLQAPSKEVRDAWCEAISVVQAHRAATRGSQSTQRRQPFDASRPDNSHVAPLDRLFSPAAPEAQAEQYDEQQQQQQQPYYDANGYDDAAGGPYDGQQEPYDAHQQAYDNDAYGDYDQQQGAYDQGYEQQQPHATFQPRGAHEDYDDYGQQQEQPNQQQRDSHPPAGQQAQQHGYDDHASYDDQYGDQYGDAYDDKQYGDEEPPMPALPDSARYDDQQQLDERGQQQQQQQQQQPYQQQGQHDQCQADGGSDDEDFSAAKSPAHTAGQGQAQGQGQGFGKFGSSAPAAAVPPAITAPRPPIPAQRPPKSSPPAAAVAAVAAAAQPSGASAAAIAGSTRPAAAARGPSRPQVVSGKPLPKVANPRLRGSAFDRHVLPVPLPPDQRQMVDVALAAVVNSAFARIAQKAEDGDLIRRSAQHDDDAALIAHLEAELRQQELEWNALAVRTADSSGSSGSISIRLATANLEHDEPHHYAAVLWLRHPLENHFEFSQSVSLMRSSDGETYTPKLVLAPTDLFALREPDEHQQDDVEVQEGQLVGALLRIELWDLVSSRHADPASAGGFHRTPRSQRRHSHSHSHNGDEGDGGHYAGDFVEVDMNDLIAAPHHVLGMPLRNDTDRAREDEWATQGVQIVMQYCVPAAAAAQQQQLSDDQDEPLSVLTAGCTDPRLSLRAHQLESELRDLRAAHSSLGEDASAYRSQAMQLAEERARASALESRLAQEQVLRVRHEQENMRLRPRVLEAVDTSAELASARRQVEELQAALAKMQADLRALSVPPDAHAMLDELLSIEQPSRANLTRIKKFILEQERVRTMLVAELGGAAAAAVTTETTHDELVRREAALQAHALALETDKRAHESHATAMRQALAAAQAQALQLSARCQAAEAEAQHAQVSIAFLQDQLRNAQQRPSASAEDDRMEQMRQQLMQDAKTFAQKPLL